MRRAIVACIRLGSTTSTSGPLGRSAVGCGSFGLDPAAPSFFGGACFAAGSAPASPIFAIGAPIFAGTPCSTRICSVPSASASRSNVALSDSTSARTSPVFTSSPLFFFHSTMVPSSIVSDSLGMLTSGIGLFSERRADQALDVLRGRDRRLLQRQAVGHRDLRATQPPDGRAEVVQAPLLHARGYL